MKESKKTINQYVAVFNDSAFTGVGIIDFEYGIEDYCITEYFTQTERRKSRNKIYTNKEGRSYIVKYGRKYYLDEFLRTTGVRG